MSSATYDIHQAVVVSSTPSTSVHMNTINQPANCSMNYASNNMTMNNNMFVPPYGMSGLGQSMNYMANTSNSSSSLSDSSVLSRNMNIQSTDSSTSTLSNVSVQEQMLLINSGQGTVCTKSYVGCPSNDFGNIEQEEPEPMSRDRCNTWPLRRPNLELTKKTNPLMHDRIPEEDPSLSNEDLMSAGDNVLSGSPQAQCDDLLQDAGDGYFEPDLGVDAASPSKKITTRRNAWGNLSYADLITQAILSSPEKRMTLAQVYEWMVQNVAYFRDKGDTNSSAGWKNSIRHNLSLHSRFMRVQNEGAGKSSWWVINPDAKPGRNPRRRAATLDNTSKSAMDKKRRCARKRVEAMRGSLRSINKAGSSQLSINGHELFNEREEPLGSQFEAFRPRTQSSVSAVAGNISPQQPFEEYDLTNWPRQAGQLDLSGVTSQAVNDLMDRTDQMRLDAADSEARRLQNGMGSSVSAQHSPQYMPSIKEEPKPAPIYHEVQAAPAQQMRASMMHCPPPPQIPPPTLHMISQQPQPQQRPAQPMSTSSNTPPVYYSPCYSMPQGNGQPVPISGSAPRQCWPQQQQQQQQTAPPQYRMPMPPPPYQEMPRAAGLDLGGLGRGLSSVPGGDLPLDLENLATLDARIMDCDVEAVLRHELSQSDSPQLQLHFDI